MTVGDVVLGGGSGDFYVIAPQIRAIDLDRFDAPSSRAKTEAERNFYALSRALGSSVTIVGTDGLPESMNVTMTEAELHQFKQRMVPLLAGLAKRYSREMPEGTEVVAVE